MAIVLSEERTRGWLVARASGSLTLDEILSFMQTARADQARRMMPLLFDASGATTDITEADVAQAVVIAQDAVRSKGPRAHVALVADDRQLYERMLLYETRCAAMDVRIIRVFRQRDEAEHWLELVTAARHFH